MIDLYFAPTPNGWKISIMLEECGLDYRVVPVNLGKGDQFEPEFLKISPNNRMPAIVDPDGPGGEPIALFESGAILTWLADKTGRFLPREGHARYRALQWLFWQVGGLGPMAGQLSHFVNYAPKEGNEYSHTRYYNEYDRLLGVMERALRDSGSDYLAGEYGVADMASFPWVVPYKRFDAKLDGFAKVRAWFDRVKAREGVRKGMDVGREFLRQGPPDEETRKRLFGQTSKDVLK